MMGGENSIPTSGEFCIPTDTMPLTPEMLEKIERLHRESEARQAMMLAVPRNAARTVEEFCIGVMSRLRGRAASVNSLPADR
jgi:hypothetical protein